MQALKSNFVACLALSVCVLIFAPTVVQAQFPSTDVSVKNFGVGAHAGTLGLGAHAYLNVTPYVSVTATIDTIPLDISQGVSFLDNHVTVETDDWVYQGGASLNLHPFGNGFRVSGGAFMGTSDVAGTQNSVRVFYPWVRDSGTTIRRTTADVTYSASFANDVLPYVGIGYQPPQSARFSFYGDLGLIYTGGTTATGSIDMDCTTTNVSLAAACEEAENEANAIYQAAIKETDKFEFYPVARAGITLRF